MTRPSPYHHENLRATLLAAAVDLIGEAGTRGFTLREVARRAGVSHNAPYRHFAAKGDLMEAIAAEGFERLTAVMRKSAARGKNPLRRLQLCGWGYVDFALRWPHHFLVMFETEESGCKPREGEAADEAFGVLLECIRSAQESGDLPAGDPMPLAWTAWSLVHGIAKLAISGNLPLSGRRAFHFTLRATETLCFGMKSLKSP